MNDFPVHVALPTISPVPLSVPPAPSLARTTRPRYRCACCIPRSAFLQLLQDVRDADHVPHWRVPAPITRPILWTCMAGAWQAQGLLSAVSPPVVGGTGHATPLVRRRGGRAAAGGGAECVLSGGRIFTADRTQLWCEALAIDAGRIVAIGTQADIEAWIGEHTEVIELDGRLVIP